LAPTTVGVGSSRDDDRSYAEQDDRGKRRSQGRQEGRTQPHCPAGGQASRQGHLVRRQEGRQRKAQKHARRYGDAARMAWSAALIYGPMAAEALGVVEQPKPRRRFPAFLAGMAVGGGLMYLAGRDRTA
jgi:hypothetical protein